MPRAVKDKPKKKVPEVKPLHPNSRKAAKKESSMLREAKITKVKKAASLKLELLGELVLWFRDNLDKEKSEYTKLDVLDIIERYLLRFDDELEQIDIVHSIKGRSRTQHASRYDVVRLQLQRDRDEFETCGLEIPDLTIKKNLAYLRNWNGELRYLSNIKLRKITKKELTNLKKTPTTKHASKAKGENIEDSECVDSNDTEDTEIGTTDVMDCT